MGKREAKSLVSRKCVTGDTNAQTARSGRRRCVGMQRRQSPKVGSLVDVGIVNGQKRIGIVIQATTPEPDSLGVQWLTVLFSDGERLFIRSPDIRVIGKP